MAHRTHSPQVPHPRRRNVVLDLDIVSDLDVGAYINVLPQRAEFTDLGPRLNMAEMPDLRSSTDFHTIIYVGAFMSEIIHRNHPKNPFMSLVEKSSRGRRTGLPSSADL